MNSAEEDVLFLAIYYWNIILPFLFCVMLLPRFVSKVKSFISVVKPPAGISKDVECEGFDLSTSIGIQVSTHGKRYKPQWVSIPVLAVKEDEDDDQADEEGGLLGKAKDHYEGNYRARNLWLTGQLPPIEGDRPFSRQMSMDSFRIGSRGFGSSFGSHHSLSPVFDSWSIDSKSASFNQDPGSVSLEASDDWNNYVQRSTMFNCYESQGNGEPVIALMMLGRGIRPKPGFEMCYHPAFSKNHYYRLQLSVQKANHSAIKKMTLQGKMKPYSDLIIVSGNRKQVPRDYEIINMLIPMSKKNEDQFEAGLDDEAKAQEAQWDDDGDEDDQLLAQFAAPSVMKPCTLKYRSQAAKTTKPWKLCAKRLNPTTDLVPKVIMDVIMLRETDEVPPHFERIDYLHNSPDDEKMEACFEIDSRGHMMYFAVRKLTVPSMDNMRMRFDPDCPSLVDEPITDIVMYTNETKNFLHPSVTPLEITGMGNTTSLVEAASGAAVYIAVAKNSDNVDNMDADNRPICGIVVTENRFVPEGYDVVAMQLVGGRSSKLSLSRISICTTRIPDSENPHVITDCIVIKGGESVPLGYRKITLTNLGNDASVGFHFRHRMYLCVREAEMSRHEELNGDVDDDDNSDPPTPITELCLATDEAVDLLSDDITVIKSSVSGYNGSLTIGLSHQPVYLCAAKDDIDSKTSTFAPIVDVQVIDASEELPPGFEFMKMKVVGSFDGKLQSIDADTNYGADIDSEENKDRDQEDTLRIAVKYAKKNPDGRYDLSNGAITGAVMSRQHEKLPSGFVKLATTKSGKSAHFGSKKFPMYLSIRGKSTAPQFTEDVRSPVCNLLLVAEGTKAPTGYNVFEKTKDGRSGAMKTADGEHMYFASQKEDEKTRAAGTQPIVDIKFVDGDQGVPAGYEVASMLLADGSYKPAQDLTSAEMKTAVKVCVKRFDPTKDSRLHTAMLTSVMMLSANDLCPEGYEKMEHPFMKGLYMAVKKNTMIGDGKTRYEDEWDDEQDEDGIVHRVKHKLRTEYFAAQAVLNDYEVTVKPAIDWGSMTVEDSKDSQEWLKLGAEGLPDDFLDVDMVNTLSIASYRFSPDHPWVNCGQTEINKDSVSPNYEKLVVIPPVPDEWKKKAQFRVEVFQIEDDEEGESVDKKSERKEGDDEIDLDNVHRNQFSTDVDVDLRSKMGQIIAPFTAIHEKNQRYKMKDKTGNRDLPPARSHYLMNKVTASEARVIREKELEQQELEKGTVKRQVGLLRQIRRLEAELKKMDKMSNLTEEMQALKQKRLIERDVALKQKQEICDRMREHCVKFFGKQKPELGMLFESAPRIQGVRVTKVHLNRAASLGLIKKQDLITKVDGKETATVQMFKEVVLANCHVGSQYAFGVARFGGNFNCNVLIGAKGVSHKTIAKFAKMVKDDITDANLADIALLRKLEWFQQYKK